MRRARRALGGVAIALAATSQAQCGSGAPAPSPTPATVQATIGPEGGDLLADDGTKLTIFPGALEAPTDVWMTRLAALDDPSWGAAVQLSPVGLSLKIPATLEVPLHATFPAAGDPEQLGFLNPGLPAETGRAPALSDDRGTAIVQVTHLGGVIVADNCHEDTRDVLTQRWTDRGCSRQDVVDRIHAHAGFENADVPGACAFLAPYSIQLLLGTFFVDRGGYDDGTDVPDDVLEELVGYVEEGRSVVLAFNQGTFGQRAQDGAGAGTGAYPSISHTAVVELQGREWQIRSAVTIAQLDEGTVLPVLHGAKVVRWPLSDLNGFRKLRQGAAVETAACGKLGCLGMYDAPEQRTVPWSAVRIFVESKPLFACGDAATSAPSDASTPPKDARGPDGARPEAGGPVDAGAPEAASRDAAPPEAAPPEAGIHDAAAPEAAPAEAGPRDAAPEAAPPEAGPREAAAPDAAPPDAAPRDAAPTDAAPLDAASTDAAPREAAAPDAGRKDSGHD